MDWGLFHPVQVFLNSTVPGRKTSYYPQRISISNPLSLRRVSAKLRFYTFPNVSFNFPQKFSGIEAIFLCIFICLAEPNTQMVIWLSDGITMPRSMYFLFKLIASFNGLHFLFRRYPQVTLWLLNISPWKRIKHLHHLNSWEIRWPCYYHLRFRLNFSFTSTKLPIFRSLLCEVHHSWPSQNISYHL